MTLRLHTIIVSTRPGRAGPAIAEWIDAAARSHGVFDARLVDLKDFDLPVFDEPKHPVMQQYEHAHTRAWSASVDAADAFVFVTPEYNFSAPPSFVNAVDYLSKEWNHKPAAFVSYGGISGGLRAVQTEKLLLTSVKVMPIPEGVVIPSYSQYIGENGRFTPNEMMAGGAKTMLDELHRWASALKPMRTDMAVAA